MDIHLSLQRLFLPALFLGAALVSSPRSQGTGAEPPLRVLIFSRVAGFYHATIDTAEDALEQWGAEHNWEITKTRDTVLFNDEDLAGFDVVVWNNNCASEEILPASGRDAFERYIRNGGGYAGIHGAAYSYFTPLWSFYADSLVGAREVNTGPCHFTALCNLSANFDDPATDMFPADYPLFDEYYSLTADISRRTFSIPADTFQVLLMAKKMDADPSCDYATGRHPVSWRHTFHAGRAFYTEVGHEPTTFRDPVFIEHLALGIQWAGTKEAVSVQNRSNQADEANALFTFSASGGIFKWQVKDQTPFTLTITDIRGSTILSATGTGSSYAWNGLNRAGSRMPAGIYFMQLNDGADVLKALIVKPD